MAVKGRETKLVADRGPITAERCFGRGDRAVGLIGSVDPAVDGPVSQEGGRAVGREVAGEDAGGGTRQMPIVAMDQVEIDA